MIILKIGGSLIAPKNTDIFNTEFLNKISIFLQELGETYIINHGAGNLGHGLVLKHGFNHTTRKMWKEDVEIHFYESLRAMFPNFSRIEIEPLLRGENDMKDLYGKNIIVGGDISPDLEILSGDTSFAYFMKEFPEKIGYMLTDIDGILDKNKNVIPEINIGDIHKVSFWKKEGDSKNSMFSKVTELSKLLKGTQKTVWIINGNDLQNIKNIIQSGKGVGTKILF